MEVTNELKTKVFALYIGCQYQLTINIENTPVIEQLTIEKLHKLFEDYWQNELPNMKQAKLLLKPLSSITDEDAIEVAKIMGSSMEEHVKLGWIALVHDMLYKGIAKPVLGSNITYIVADYLRSKSYALPYMGIDLFASGIATPSTLTDKSK